jgi:pimeloyl-ACP methyl ester carboxylesterase
MPNADSSSPDTIVLIHGLWMTPLSWEKWIDHYQGRGFKVIASAWPGLDRPIEELRRDPTPIAGLGLAEIVDHYDRIINGLERPPIVIGHSFGGLITQILLHRGLGASGVAIASAPVKGVIFLPFSTIKVVFPVLSNPLNVHRAMPLTEEQFHYAFTNTLSEQESKAVYDRYAVPGPDHVLFQAGLANFNPHAATAVDFHNDTRAALLMIAGELDHISPPAVVKANYNLYRKSNAITDYREFAGRSHYILGQDGWQEVADYSLYWAVRNARSAMPVT